VAARPSAFGYMASRPPSAMAARPPSAVRHATIQKMSHHAVPGAGKFANLAQDGLSECSTAPSSRLPSPLPRSPPLRRAGEQQVGRWAAPALPMRRSSSAGAVVAQAFEQHVQEYTGPTGPANLQLCGAALVNPLFGNSSARGRTELQKMIHGMDFPLLIMPCREDPTDVRAGGLIDQQSKAAGRSLEFLEFSRVEHGFVTQGFVIADEVRMGVEWAMECASEFFHVRFLKAEEDSSAAEEAEAARKAYQERLAAEAEEASFRAQIGGS
jgi:hypothetical protein